MPRRTRTQKVTERERPKTVASRQVYAGRLVRFRVDTVRLEDGREFEREVVEHARSVVVVPMTDRETVLLVRQWRQATGEWLLEAPAGRMEEGEKPEDTAQRELREETGFSAKVLRPLGGFWTAPGLFTEYMYAFVATGLRRAPLPQDPGEGVSVEEVRLDEVPGMIESGAIRDAKTIASVLSVLMRRGAG